MFFGIWPPALRAPDVTFIEEFCLCPAVGAVIHGLLPVDMIRMVTTVEWWLVCDQEHQKRLHFWVWAVDHPVFHNGWVGVVGVEFKVFFHALFTDFFLHSLFSLL